MSYQLRVRFSEDQAWRLYPWTFGNEAAAERIVDWLTKLWGRPLEYRLTRTQAMP